MSGFQIPKFGISVLMPVHNAGDYLNPAVTSILNQQGVLLELIIIDDHSTDTALSNLPLDSRIERLKSSKRGIVAALSLGLKYARYPFIARMDADDIADSKRLLTQIIHFQGNPELDICGTKVRIFSDQTSIADGYSLYQQWINNLCSAADIERDFFVESPIPHPSAMLRREYINSIGGYIDCEWPEDYDLWCRALLAGAVFGKPGLPDLLLWRDHGDRLSRSDERYSKQMFLRCKAHYLAQYLDNKGVKFCTILGTGPTGLKLHDYLELNGLPVAGFIDINEKLRDRQKRSKAVQILQRLPNDQQLNAHIDQKQSIIIAAVSARGARERIRTYLTSSNLVEQRDYIFAA
jgi:glycosyltransferase involved in cell wall biosynthesis